MSTGLKEELIKRIEKLLQNNPLERIKLDLEDNFVCNVPGLRILTRVKEISRALEKIDRKGYTQIDQFTDLLGMKIITRNLSDLYKIVNYINNNYHPHSANNYIKYPQATGYMGYHTNFYYNGINVEVQAQTHAMAKASNITHDTFYKQLSGNAISNLIQAVKKFSPEWINKPIINTAQKIIFKTVIPFETLRKGGLHEYVQYQKDLKHFKTIDFTRKALHIPSISYVDMPTQNPITLGEEEILKIHKSIKEQYESEFPEIRYAKEYTSLKIKDINEHFGRNLSLKEMKLLRNRLGQEVEKNLTSADIDIFIKLNDILTDIRYIQKLIRDKSIQQKDTYIKKSMDIEI